MGTTPPPAWVSELAEELAPLAARGIPGAAAIGQRIREEAQAHSLSPWVVTQAVGREWDRLGIIRVGAGSGRLDG